MAFSVFFGKIFFVPYINYFHKKSGFLLILGDFYGKDFYFQRYDDWT